MTDLAFAAEFARYGPARRWPPPSRSEAQAYCRRLARVHYENFTVASWLLPHGLRQHFCNFYAYCRWADDLADEPQLGHDSRQLLDWWEQQLRACFSGQARHPVFVALWDTISAFEIPMEPLLDLLVAFRQDQQKQRYETFDELLEYCRYSANPVGRVILYMARRHNDATVALSDSICTGLQLANFWQDVARDHDRGRVYLPQDSCRRFGYTDAMLARRETNDRFRRVLACEVDRAEAFLQAGLPLVKMVPKELRVDVQLFIDGGRSVLQAIRRIDYDVWSRRPTVGRLTKIGMLLGAWWRLRWAASETAKK